MPAVPEDYGLLPAYLRMRIAERFGLDPFTLDGWTPGQVALAESYELVREHEEAREAAAWQSR